MSDKGDFLAGLMVGGLIGLAVGVLFAPDAGDQTRSAVRDRASDTLDRVREVGGRVREGVDRVRDGVHNVSDSVRERLSGADDPAADEAPATPTA